MPLAQQCAKIFGTITAGAGTTYAINKTDRNGDRKLSSSHQEQDTWLQMSCDGSFWPRPRGMSESSENGTLDNSNPRRK